MAKQLPLASLKNEAIWGSGRQQRRSVNWWPTVRAMRALYPRSQAPGDYDGVFSYRGHRLVCEVKLAREQPWMRRQWLDRLELAGRLDFDVVVVVMPDTQSGEVSDFGWMTTEGHICWVGQGVTLAQYVTDWFLAQCEGRPFYNQYPVFAVSEVVIKN